MRRIALCVDDSDAAMDALTKGIGRAEPVLLVGHSAADVCERAEQTRPDLIVTASHRGTVERGFLGSFFAHPARHASCHVLMVHPSAAEAADAHARAATNPAEPAPAG